ncbi:MAG TPA: hypothetical protein VG722_09670 [Tepidisphaeraceae bacterium]|nr:hypothetical protein [Tepidisphaeraceae bacterium]
MSENIEHCPFLNRADRRCARHLNLSQLNHAMEYCFDRFEYCPIYLQRVTERRQRGMVMTNTSSYGASRLVQLQVPARYQKQPA